MKKTFAQEMAELAMPAPRKEIDPEAELMEDAPVLEESDEELLDLQHSRGAERSRMRAGVGLEDDPEYIGKKSSRAGFFGKEAVEDEISEEEDDEDGTYDEENVKYSEEESTEGSHDDVEPQQEDGFDSAELSGSEEETKTRQHQEHAASDHYDAEEDLEREFEAVENAEAEAAQELRERALKEHQKAVAVKNQRKMWNRGLEARIMLQKVLEGSNRLPHPDMYTVIHRVDPDLAESMQRLAEDARQTIGDLAAAVDACAEQHPDISDGKKRQRETFENEEINEIWNALEERYSAFSSYRDGSIDRWHRKTMLSSGNAGKKGMKVLNQSISKQVSLLMKDKERIGQRSQLPASHYNGLCRIMEHTGQSTQQQKVSEGDTTMPEETRIPHTYQDGEFYQALLNEFLEGKSDALIKGLHKGPKQRKIVDRRASKGRKIRYHVHEKLVNFMAPADMDIPNYTTRIFSNLFGRRADDAN